MSEGGVVLASDWLSGRVLVDDTDSKVQRRPEEVNGAPRTLREGDWENPKATIRGWGGPLCPIARVSASTFRIQREEGGVRYLRTFRPETVQCSAFRVARLASGAGGFHRRGGHWPLRAGPGVVGAARGRQMTPAATFFSVRRVWRRVCFVESRLRIWSTTSCLMVSSAWALRQLWLFA